MKEEKKKIEPGAGQSTRRRNAAVLDKERIPDTGNHVDPKVMMASILDAIPHAVLGLENRKIIFANHATETVFGWSPHELTGQSTRLLYRSDEEYEEIAARFYPSLIKQRTYSDEFICRHRDGRDIVCMVSTSRVGESLRERMIVVTYEDITVRKRAEEKLRESRDILEEAVRERTKELEAANRTLERDIAERTRVSTALRESEEKFRILSEKAIVGVYLIQDMRFQYVNPRCADIWGYTADELLEQKLENLIAPEDATRVGENLRKRISGKVDFLQYELKAVKKSGEIIFMEVYGSRIMYKGRPAIIGTLIDISDRMRADEERRRRERLEWVLEMAGTICHEINQPMQVISGYSDHLLMHASINDPIYNQLYAINEQIQRMGVITTKLMMLKEYETEDYLGFGRIINIHKDSDTES